MFQFLKKKKTNLSALETLSQETLFPRLRTKISRARQNLAEGLAHLFLGKKEIDEVLLDELETRLIAADFGVVVTQEIIANLTARLNRKELNNAIALKTALREILREMLWPYNQPLLLDETKQPFIVLLVGVNGAGKTTTIGKLTRYWQQQGKKIMLAAGDTFRAAAIQQLASWGKSNQVAVVAQHSGADSAAVIYDAIQSAKSKGIDVLIADTAGRLHTQTNLMEELKKIKRTIQKIDATAPHEVLLILDATIGQNALNQAREFNDAVGVTGICLTKLDGTAKGGIIFSVVKTLHLPVRFIGIGEHIEDLQPFDADGFINALFSD